MPFLLFERLLFIYKKGMDSNCVSMTCYDQTFIKTYMLPAIVVNSCLLN